MITNWTSDYMMDMLNYNGNIIYLDLHGSWIHAWEMKQLDKLIKRNRYNQQIKNKTLQDRCKSILKIN